MAENESFFLRSQTFCSWHWSFGKRFLLLKITAPLFVITQIFAEQVVFFDSFEIFNLDFLREKTTRWKETRTNVTRTEMIPTYLQRRLALTNSNIVKWLVACTSLDFDKTLPVELNWFHERAIEKEAFSKTNRFLLLGMQFSNWNTLSLVTSSALSI